MKTTLISAFGAIILSVGMSAKADIIKCTYTEPFISTTYSMTQSKLTIEDHSAQIINVIRNVSFQIMGPGEFELWDKNRQVVHRLFLDFKGSDGMSDRIYPYTGVRGGQYGGCTSNFLHAN